MCLVRGLSYKVTNSINVVVHGHSMKEGKVGGGEGREGGEGKRGRGRTTLGETDTSKCTQGRNTKKALTRDMFSWWGEQHGYVVAE